MSKRFALALVLAFAACEPGPGFRPYEAPGGEFSLDVPGAWAVYTNFGTARASPIAYVITAGGEQRFLNGDIQGPRIAVYRLTSRREDFKGSDAQWEAYKLEHLAPAIDLFHQKLPQTSTMTVSGQPARTFFQAYRTIPANERLEEPTDYQLEQVVLVRPAAVYLLELRCYPQDLAKFHSLFMRMVESFKLRTS